MSEEVQGSWQPDPSGANEYRYHDGTQFTEHVANGGLVGVAPMGERDPNAPAAVVQETQPVTTQTGFEQAGTPVGVGQSHATATQTQGITGALLGTGDADHMVGEADVVQGRFLKCLLNGNQIVGRQGSMVAYQGNVDFDYQGQGIGNLFKKALTGEGVPLMRMQGHGEVYLAQQGEKVHIVHLNNASLSINGRNVLAFSPSLNYNIEMIKGGAIKMVAGGLVNTVLSGTGWVAFSTDGDPVVLNAAEAPTFVDTNAIVGWSTGLQASLKSTFKAGALIGRGSGEMFQAQFTGNGFVIVQPSEGYIPQVAS